MAGFSEIVGHEQMIAHLKNSIRTKKISHAYILQGPDGSGKKMLAKAFAMTLECEEQGEEPCMHCHSCIQVLNDSQPDIIFVRPEKTKNISVDDIRKQVNKDIAIKPYSSPYKIYIIDHAENLNQQAENALLKTMEEPPEYAIILLLTTNANALLPTILSRCVTLSLRAVPDDQVKEYLMQKRQISESKADLCVAFAQGVIGKALLLAESEEFSEIKEEAIQLLKRTSDIDTYEMAMAVKQIKEYDMGVNDFIDILMVWYRDELLFKATQDANRLVFKEEAMEIRRQSEKCSYSGIEEILNALEKAKVRLRANVNYDLTMELLLATIKENQR